MVREAAGDQGFIRLPPSTPSEGEIASTIGEPLQLFLPARRSNFCLIGFLLSFLLRPFLHRPATHSLSSDRLALPLLPLLREPSLSFSYFAAYPFPLFFVALRLFKVLTIAPVIFFLPGIDDRLDLLVI